MVEKEEYDKRKKGKTKNKMNKEKGSSLIHVNYVLYHYT